MKIKTVKKSYDEVLRLPKPEHKDPKISLPLLRWAMKTAGAGDLKAVNFRWELSGLDRLPDEPCMVLMNHSSFVDLEMASNILYPKPFAIVCTSDGFVGKEWLMRGLGCIPTNKFVTDVGLMSDIKYALRTNKTHVLMYPEASYSFDGRATPLPARFGVFLKSLKVPVLMIRTYGAFARDPLYNCLQKRKVDVRAVVSMLFAPEDLKARSTEELDAKLSEVFSFDNFAWQKENNIVINENFRADGLDRILYKCDACGREDGMKGQGTRIRCGCCGREYELTELGELALKETGTASAAVSGQALTEGFTSVPAWYDWERDEVRREIESGTYLIDCDVDIRVFRDFKAIYEIGEGRLVHNNDGFVLTGPDGREYCRRRPGESYSLYSDYYWYELGDMICIGDNEMQFYCFPKTPVPVAKARIAAEEMFKIAKPRKRRASS
ncbi:MAG: 1-acyl-sn-glycerol-3-phosphate acyltransferase [Firmicutes bacterium]|nr:1-acyl-sn-glycerol-3-phosphate acyltransferase [Bacillota bacterium]